MNDNTDDDADDDDDDDADDDAVQTLIRRGSDDGECLKRVRKRERE